MPSFIDNKYLGLITHRLQLFKVKRHNPYLANFRCVYCGDSQKKKSRTRGYLYQKKNDLFFHCHNCGQSTTFANFLKYLDVQVHNDYVLERYKEGKTGYGSNTANPTHFTSRREQPTFQKKQLDLETIDSLVNDHFAKVYLQQRRIPTRFMSSLYFAPDFKEFVASINQIASQDLIPDEQRIIIPFFDQNKNLIAFQGRAFLKSNLRYVTIKVDEDATKIFGLDRLNMEKPFHIVEGPFDSMFLPNAIAMAGSDFHLSTDSPILRGLYEKRGTVVFDNEPRNKEILNKMEHVIDRGWNICIWPKSVIQKDLNDMILNGMTDTELLEVINKNTLSGLSAKTQLAIWRKK